MTKHKHIWMRTTPQQRKSWICTYRIPPDGTLVSDAADWYCIVDRCEEARCEKHRVSASLRPKRKPKPFARWSDGGASENLLFYCARPIGVIFYPNGDGNARQVVAALNKHRVALKGEP